MSDWKPKITALFGALLIFAPALSYAQDSSVPAPAGSAALPPICTDRPTKSNVPCTVDAGHFQYESDLYNGTFQHVGGVTTQTDLVANPTLKYGVSPTVDVELNMALYEEVGAHGTGGKTDLSSVGDLYLRVKANLYSSPKGALTASVIPYVKAPTARFGVGDGVVEEGVLAPISYKISDLLTLTSVPELDILKNTVGDGRHSNTAQLLNLAYSLPHSVTVYGEVWGDWNFDPTGTVRQASADLAAAWGATAYLQFDLGLNLGLSRATPGTQVYVGVAQKF